MGEGIGRRVGVQMRSGYCFGGGVEICRLACEVGGTCRQVTHVSESDPHSQHDPHCRRQL